MCFTQEAAAAAQQLESGHQAFAAACKQQALRLNELAEKQQEGAQEQLQELQATCETANREVLVRPCTSCWSKDGMLQGVPCCLTSRFL